MDLRQAIEMARRILTKEKIDRQLAGQTSSTPFMSIRDGLSNRGRGQTGCNYDQKRYEGRIRSNSVYRGCSRYNQNFRGRMRYDSNKRDSQRFSRNSNNDNGRGSYRN